MVQLRHFVEINSIHAALSDESIRSLAFTIG
jgi:hypothetical protein